MQTAADLNIAGRCVVPFAGLGKFLLTRITKPARYNTGAARGTLNCQVTFWTVGYKFAQPNVFVNTGGTNLSCLAHLNDGRLGVFRNVVSYSLKFFVFCTQTRRTKPCAVLHAIHNATTFTIRQLHKETPPFMFFTRQPSPLSFRNVTLLSHPGPQRRQQHTPHQLESPRCAVKSSLQHDTSRQSYTHRQRVLQSVIECEADVAPRRHCVRFCVAPPWANEPALEFVCVE